MYEGSLGLRNLSFAVLSKQLVMLSMSSGVLNRDPFSFSVRMLRLISKMARKAQVLHYLPATGELDVSRTPSPASDLLLSQIIDQGALVGETHTL